MKKFIVLILGLSLTAASCNISSDIFSFGGATRGVFRSDDIGETFNSKNALNKGDISSLSINALAFNPTNTNTLFVASASGIHKSENAGDKWTYILSGIGIADISIDPNSPQTIYASGLSGQNGKIIKSVDGGSSWVDIYTEPSKNNTVLSVQVSRSNSSVILAGLLSGELIRSTDAGRTWQATKDFGDRVTAIKFGPGPIAYALTQYKGVFESSDSGVTWIGISDSLTAQTLNSVYRVGSSVTAFYGLALDQRQSGVLYLGTEEGLYRTVNDGKDWALMALPVKAAALRVSAVTINPDDSNNLFVSVQSTLYKSNNGGLTWQTKTLPTTAVIHTILVNPQSTNIIYLGIKS